MREYHFLFLIGFLLLCPAIASADDNASIEANLSTENINQLTGNTTVNESSILNESVPADITQANESVDFAVTNVIPQEFKVGDAQFNIQLKNTGGAEVKNIMAFVSGRGFSTYSVIPIEQLRPDESSYIIVSGNFRERGNLTLAIRVNDKLFYQNVTVVDPGYVDDQEKLKEMQEAEEAKKKLIENLTASLDELENKYAALENEIRAKKSGYDVSEVSLADLKNFLRDARSGIAVGDANKAEASISLASSEYAQQKNKIENAGKIKKSFLDSIKNNLVLISSMAASIITLFAFYELLKKKKGGVSKKVAEVKSKIGKKGEGAESEDKKKEPEKEAKKEEEKPEEKKERSETGQEHEKKEGSAEQAKS